MTDQPRSPAAQAVLNACNEAVERLPLTAEPEQFSVAMIAAALRAAVDQADPKLHIKDIDYQHQSYVDGWNDALDFIRTITDELEGKALCNRKCLPLR
jgi:hypothetical protein